VHHELGHPGLCAGAGSHVTWSSRLQHACLGQFPYWTTGVRFLPVAAVLLSAAPARATQPLIEWGVKRAGAGH
jgi:hypothetical protein